MGQKYTKTRLPGPGSVLEVEASGLPCQPPLGFGHTPSLGLRLPSAPYATLTRRAQTSLKLRHTAAPSLEEKQNTTASLGRRRGPGCRAASAPHGSRVPGFGVPRHNHKIHGNFFLLASTFTCWEQCDPVTPRAAWRRSERFRSACLALSTRKGSSGQGPARESSAAARTTPRLSGS